MSSPHAAKRQQGSALIWVVTLFFMFSMAALVVDGSRVYLEQRNIQSAANMLVSRLAEEAQTCGGVTGGVDVTPQANLILADLISDGLIRQGSWEVSYASLSLIEADPSAPARRYNISMVQDAEQSNGVSLGLEKSIDGGLLLFVLGDDFRVRAEASVLKESVAGLSIESEIASLDTQSGSLLNIVFGQLLGTSLSLSVNGLNELAQAVTSVDQLVSDLGLAETLDAIPAADLLEGVLDATDGLTFEAANVLDQLINAAAGNNISANDIIAGVHEVQVPPGSNVNALGFVQSVLLNVDGALPKNIGIDLLGEASLLSGLGTLLSSSNLLNVQIELEPSPGFVLASAKTDAFGDWPTARSSSIGVVVNSEINLAGLVRTGIEINLQTAAADVELRNSDCASGTSNTIQEISFSGASSLLSADLDISVLQLLGGLLGISINNAGSFASAAGGINGQFFDIELDGYNQLQATDKEKASFNNNDIAVSSISNALVENLQVCVTLLFLPICTGSTVSSVLVPLTNVITGILDVIIAPLLDALGITLAPSELVLVSIGQTYHVIEKGLVD